MNRRVAALLFPLWAAAALAQQQTKPPETVEPPEEDETLQPKEYVFNPLQAQKEFTVGNFYFKRQSWKAASLRYDEATKWNPGYADAWFRLAETREKLKDADGARQAYRKFLDLAPDDKRAAEAKKKSK